MPKLDAEELEEPAFPKGAALEGAKFTARIGSALLVELESGDLVPLTETPQLGDTVVAPTLFGHVGAHIARRSNGDWMWESDAFRGNVKYDEGRGEWISDLVLSKESAQEVKHRA